MVFKLTEAADLEKAGRSLGSYFAKQAEELLKTHALHAAAAAHHEAMAGCHKAMAACCKASHDSMADDHDMKSHMGKSHSHHEQMATHHEAVSKAHGAHAESMKAEVDNLKAMASDWGATGVVKTGATSADLTKGTLQEKFTTVTDAVMNAALEKISTSPEIAQALQALALEKVNQMIGEQLGSKLVPTQVSAIAPPHLTAVPRTGAPAIQGAKPNVPIEFEKLFKVEDEESVRG